MKKYIIVKSTFPINLESFGAKIQNLWQKTNQYTSCDAK